MLEHGGDLEVSEVVVNVPRGVLEEEEENALKLPNDDEVRVEDDVHHDQRVEP